MEFVSEVINAYLKKLVERYNHNNTTRAFAVDSFEITRIWEGKKPKIKIVPQLYKFILGVVNQAHHWMLVVILPAQKKSLFLDPLGENKKAVGHCKDVTRSLMRQRGLNPSRWECETNTHSIQQDATSCGAFALKFAECILNGLPLVFDTSPSSVNSIREEIAVSLLMNTDDLTDLCRICGENTGDTLWIGCDKCLRWFHKICAKYPKNGRRSYVCEACK
ncbi:sentrin-specific protease 1-like [Sparus aurata]|uniref:sentrin-specific protease 1-like n=1 Tax=Sparus aurata TaxID=8175 RepID=UPI0011C16A7F|nr:sentrin-specific protease 1-like [Sparus aurata]